MGKLEILGDNGSWQHHISENEKKIKKSISEDPENYMRQNSIERTLSKGLIPGLPPTHKIFWTILDLA